VSGPGRAGGLAALLALATAYPAAGWHTIGHGLAASAAVRALPEGMPAFFRAGGSAVAHSAADPDLAKSRSPEIQTLRAGEEPEHYLDWERLAGRALPANRVEHAALLAALGRRAAEVGAVTLAVEEGTQRLALCFAEHRRWPDNPHVRAKCLVDAGRLAHYAGDLAQPLHTTVHHDGWALPDGLSPFTGIHARVDALLEKARFDRELAVAGLAPTPFPDLRAGIAAELAASHARIDAVYRLEPELLAEGGGAGDPEVQGFACERYRATALFIARLFATAWETSERIELPGWLWRESFALEPARP
jgi:hypothetical protein